MATTIQSFSMSAGVNINISDAKSFGTVSFSQQYSPASASLTNGTGAGKMSKFYAHQETLAASGAADIDLSGTLTDPLGNTVVFTKIKAIYLEVLTSATGTDCTIGGGHANQLVAWQINVVNGGFFELFLPDASGIAVGAGASDVFQVTNNDGTNQLTFRAFFGGE